MLTLEFIQKSKKKKKKFEELSTYRLNEVAKKKT